MNEAVKDEVPVAAGRLRTKDASSHLAPRDEASCATGSASESSEGSVFLSATGSASESNGGGQPAHDDPRVAQALAEYVAALDSGEPVDREQFLCRHAEIAVALVECLEGLEFIHGAAAKVHELDEDATRANPLDELQPPFALGDYKILRELGRGGMGVVYEAQQLSLSRRVALKVLPFAAVLDPRHLQRFKNEAIAAAQLAHPHIVDVHGVGCERGIHFYAMRLIEGQTLAAVIEAMKDEIQGTKDESSRPAPRDEASPLPLGEGRVRGCGEDESSVGNGLRAVPALPQDDATPLGAPGTPQRAFPTENEPMADGREPTAADPIRPSSFVLGTTADTVREAVAALSTLRTTRPRDFFRRVAELGIQAAEALDHAHQMGIVHRDIKPSNLMLDHFGKLWITDFGLARVQSDASMTMTGDLLGTLRYMSPEQASGAKVVDERTDIYSLGITLYELLTLRPAFPAEDRHALLQKIANDEPPAPRKLNPAIPIDLETIIRKAATKEPADRYQSSRHVADDLRRFAAREPIRAEPPTVLQRIARWSRRHRGLVSAAAILLAVTAALTSAAAVLFAIERDKTIVALAGSDRERSRAQDNLRIARQAVDDMYTKVATVWLAKESAPSAIQNQLLTKALQVYEALARELPTDEVSRHNAAEAFERIGEIEHFLGHDRNAAEALKTSIQLELENTEPQALRNVAFALTGRHRKLAHVLIALAQTTSAEQAYSTGLQFSSSLAEAGRDTPEHALELARFRLLGGELAALAGRFDEAESLARRVIEEMQSLRREHEDLDVLVVQFKAQVALVDYLRRLGRVQEAEKQGANTLGQIHVSQRNSFHDARELLELEALAHEQLASVALVSSQPDGAAEHLRQSLRLKQQNLRARERPIAFIMRFYWTQKSQANLDENYELAAFCGYAETQLRLAKVVHSLDRPHEAAELLGESMLMAYMLCSESGHNLRFMRLYGDIWSAAAELFAGERPEDVKHLQNAADSVWQALAAHFPHAITPYGLPDVRHRPNADLQFGQNALPLPERDLYKNLTASPIWQTGFVQQALGSSWFRIAAWDAAIQCFEKSAALRVNGRAYDFFHIAMAHHRLGNDEEAATWFNRALEAMGEAPTKDLLEIRAQAEEATKQIAKGKSRG